MAQQDLAAQQDLEAQHVLVAHPQPNWHLTLSQPRSVLQPEIKCAMIHHGILFSIRFYIKLFCLHSTQQRHGLLAQHEPHLPSVRLQLLPQFRARSRKKMNQLDIWVRYTLNSYHLPCFGPQRALVEKHELRWQSAGIELLRALHAENYESNSILIFTAKKSSNLPLVLFQEVQEEAHWDLAHLQLLPDWRPRNIDQKK